MSRTFDLEQPVPEPIGASRTTSAGGPSTRQSFQGQVIPEPPSCRSQSGATRKSGGLPPHRVDLCAWPLLTTRMQCCSYSSPVLQPALQPLAATCFSLAGQHVDCCIPAAQPTAGSHRTNVRHSTSVTPKLWTGLHTEPTSSMTPAAALTVSSTCAAGDSVGRNPESGDSTITSQAAQHQAALANSVALEMSRDTSTGRCTIPTSADARFVASEPAAPSSGVAVACVPQQLEAHPAAALDYDAVAAAGGDQAAMNTSPHTLAPTEVDLHVKQQVVHGDHAVVTALESRQHDGTLSACGGCEASAAAAATVTQAPAEPGSAGDAEHIAGACDHDALQAAAQLLMLQSAAAEDYPGAIHGFDIAAAAATAAEHSIAGAQGYALHSSNVDGRMEVASEEHVQSVEFSSVRKRHRKPQLQQHQPSTVLDTVATAGQQQDQQQSAALAPGRRSKRARKTSYKAAEAAAFEDAFAELLLQPAWLLRNNASRSAADAVALDAGYGDQHAGRKATHQHLRGSSPDSGASSEYEDSERAQASKHLARTHGASLGGHQDPAAARARGVVPSSGKRCLVRTSLLPVATAVQQKLQHVLSFFPDVQLPGASLPQYQLLQQHTQPAEAFPQEFGAESVQPAATAAASAAATNVAPAEQQQPDSPTAAGTRIEVSPPPALRASTGSADGLHQVDAQHQIAEGASVASSRPRRTPKPNTLRHSGSPAPRVPKHYSEATQQQALHQYPLHDAATAAAATLEALAAAASAPAAAPGIVKNKGGRPRGSGNKRQMAPRATDKMGRAGFALRSAKYTGVYQSRRAHEGWRAQFCFSNKVLNLGTYATEDDAARAWNAAALFFRGNRTWLNPVMPALPNDYVAGCLGSSVPAATATAAAAVAAKAKQ